MNRDAEIVQRTRFLDKYFCEEYAKIFLWEYLHNDKLREDVDRITQGKIKTLYGDKELPGFESYLLSMTMIMAMIGDELYEITERITAEDEGEEEP